MPVVTTKNPTSLEDQQKPLIAQRDPNTTQQTQNPTIPYEQKDQLTPIIKPQKQQVTNTAQGNEQVMLTAQQAALDAQNKPNQTMGLVQQGVQGLLTNPLGYDKNKYQQNQIEQYDRNRASAMKAYQQSTADVANTGINAQNAYNYAMQGAQGRSDLQNTLAMEQADKERAAMLQSLTAGQDVSKTQSGLDETAFNRLLDTRSQYEGERSQTQGFENNVTLANLGFDQAVQMAAIQNGYDLNKLNTTYGLEMSKMIAQNDWAGAQAALDREAAILAQSTDLAAKQAFQDKQNAFDMEKLNKTQDWQSAQNKISQDFELAMQSNDINATAANIQKQIDLDKWKQENGQTFTAEQNAMNRALELSLKTMDVQGQSELMNLKAKLDMNQLVASQDFDALQAALDRSQQTAMQDKTGTLQKELVTLQGEVDKAKQEAQNAFDDSQRIATQSWQTGEAVREEDAAKAAQYFDWQQKNLAQTNDLEGQKALATLKNSFDLNIKTQDMAHDEKMLYLGSQYEEAKANNDVDRQKDILGFSYTQDLSKMAVEQGYETAKITMQGDIQKALQNGDFEHAEAMQKALFTQQTTENAKDRVIQQAQVDLQAKGINLEALDADYKRLEAQVEAGLLNPSVLTDFVNKTLSTSGVKMTAPDQLAAQKEADKEFAALQKEYARTHPGTIGPDGEMTKEGAAAFNEFINKSLYGEGTTGSAESLSQKATEALSDEQKYKALLSDPSVKEWTPQMGYDSGGFWGTDKRTFANAPAKGSIMKYNGVAYEVLTEPALETKGNNVEWFNVKDLSTGTVKRVSINPSISGATKATDFITGL